MMLAAGSIICLVELALVRFVPGLILGAIAGKMAMAATPYLLSYGVAIIALALTTIIVNYAIGVHRFAFVIPLLLVEIGEIAGITLRSAMSSRF
jgi:uncharacterized membrane protein YcaP (DUF421 family)